MMSNNNNYANKKTVKNLLTEWNLNEGINLVPTDRVQVIKTQIDPDDGEKLLTGVYGEVLRTTTIKGERCAEINILNGPQKDYTWTVGIADLKLVERGANPSKERGANPSKDGKLWQYAK